MPLTPQQKRKLKSQGQTMPDDCRLGKGLFSDAFAANLNRLLDRKGLVKMRFTELEGKERKELANGGVSGGRGGVGAGRRADGVAVSGAEGGASPGGRERGVGVWGVGCRVENRGAGGSVWLNDVDPGQAALPHDRALLHGWGLFLWGACCALGAAACDAAAGGRGCFRVCAHEGGGVHLYRGGVL